MTEVINFLQLLSFVTPKSMNNYLCAELIVVQGVFIVKEKINKNIVTHNRLSFNELCFHIVLSSLESVTIQQKKMS